MLNKVQSYAILSGDTARQITSSREQWTDFLRLAGRLYKYPFGEQLLIYAQRPEAEACAEYDFWNSRMQRYVRRGSKGIALIDESGSQPRLKYVFDVADTGGRRKPYLWQYDEAKHQDVVTAALAEEYGADSGNGLAEQLRSIAAFMAEEYWRQNQEDILGEVYGSALSRLPQEDIGASYLEAAEVSIAYTLLSRCGLNPNIYFEHEEFLSIFDFNTPATVSALGAAVSDCSEPVLRQIEVVVKNYEREHISERIKENGKTDIPADGRLSVAGIEYGRVGNGQTTGQIRSAAEGLSAGEQAGSVDGAFGERQAAQPPAGDRGGGQPQTGADDERNGEVSRDNGKSQVRKSSALGGVDEQPASAGGGDNSPGSSVQLTPQEFKNDWPAEVVPQTVQLNLFEIAIPSEQEQRAAIEKAAPFVFKRSNSAPPFPLKTAAFVKQKFGDEEIDNVLRFGCNKNKARMEIAAEFSKQKSLGEKAAYLQNLFEGGSGFLNDAGNISVWFADEGIRISRRSNARYAQNAQIVSWEQAAERIDKLLNAGEFASEWEIAKALDYERERVAEDLWYIARDLSDEGKKQGLFSHIRAEAYAVGMGGFPEQVAKVAQMLAEDEQLSQIIAEYGAFQAAYAQNREVMRFKPYAAEGLAVRLADLKLPRLKYTSQMQEMPAVGQFITEDEIAASLSYGSGFENGKYRIYSFFKEQHTAKEKADFLKNEFGTGGRSNALPGSFLSDEWHDVKGIKYSKPNCPDVMLNWPNVVKRIDRLIAEERYITAEELAKWAEQTKTVPEAVQTPEINNIEETVLENKDIEAVEAVEPEVEVLSPQNYAIWNNDLGSGGAKAKYAMNVAAIKTLKQIEAEKRQTTPEEQEILSQYVGWGALPEVFDSTKENWQAEYAELKSLLTDAEYIAARGSVLNAHYTSPTVINAIYSGLAKLGFANGKILEPACGVGNFFGLLPEKMQQSQLYGVELDSLTGRIARQLYPNANIQIKGFEQTNFQDNSFDVAIGNVPFGNYQVNDKDYNKLGFSIHNYFFAKALDKIHPGGVLALVTSRYTMDAKDSRVRRYLAERADLLGAVRLPNNAFKKNAGTEIVSDIIFLQKREQLRDLSEETPEWVEVGENEQGFKINQYFINHSEQVLGETAAVSTQYGRLDYTLNPLPGVFLAEQLPAALANIQGKYIPAEQDIEVEAAINESVDLAEMQPKNYSFVVANNEVFYCLNDNLVKRDLGNAAKERIKALVELRDCTQQLISMQMNEDMPDTPIQNQQAELNRLYDSFSKRFGLINDRANRLAFSEDSSYYLLCALEILDDENKLKRKADMFSKRTIQPYKAPERVDTAAEALAVSIAEKACVDLAYMSKLSGKGADELISDLQGVIFKDPTNNLWQTADEYLSGNVRKKLKIAEFAAEGNPAFTVNVEALRQVQPKDLEAQEIEVRLGATWIDKEYFQQFMWEVLETPGYLQDKITIDYSAHTAEWHINSKNSVSNSDVAAYSTYGTDRANAYKILEDSLNLRDVRIYDTVEEADGSKKRVFNAKETTLAAQKQQALREAFKDWIWREPERRDKLVRQYNEEMNCFRPREYDGSHIKFVGMNPEIRLREHQINAVARVIYGGNTLLAHEVGAGKTFEMIAAAMESKRLGLCHKSLFVVPNHLVEQWSAEILRLYPAANVLVTTKKDFEKSNRKKFCARIATGDYDCVIIGQSQFEKIPISPERQERLLYEQIDEITAGIAELKANNGERFNIKQMEITKKRLIERLEKMQAQAGSRKDSVICFEELGVDRMFVDESDNYKNLFLYTKMRNVAGLSTTDAQKSSDMFAKCRYLDELTGGKGVIFATGTPISNSMTEMYTIQRYLQYDRLQEMGMGHFDCWASRFGETTTSLELAPEGTGYRARTRFAKFFNLPELMAIFREVADIKTADQLNLPTPEVEYHTLAAKPTEHQQIMVKELSERAEAIHKGAVEPEIDNMLKVTSDGRKLGLDQRLINSTLPDEENTKVNMCVANVLKYWREGEKDRLTQLVFCDISTPQAEVKEQEGFSNVYADIKQKLVAGGMEPQQVAFIHEAKTDLQKKELFAKVRSGQVRVLIGSTAKMGAGTNVQDRLIASHDLDCPWRPRDLIQREGRIRRQGNMNKQVHVCRYVTEATFDAYLWQTIENKQKFISQIMTSKSPVRSCEDVDEAALSYAEIKALCAGDPRIKERMELDVEVNKLKIMKASHQSQQYRLQDRIIKYFPEQIAAKEAVLAALQADKAVAENNRQPKDGFIGMEIDGAVYHEKDKAGAALLEKAKSYVNLEAAKIGSYRGFNMYLSREGFQQNLTLTLKGALEHKVELGGDIRGNLIRIDNALGQIDKRIADIENTLDNLHQQVEAAKIEVGKPFEFEGELAQKNARLIELDMELNMDMQSEEVEQAEPVEEEIAPEEDIKPGLAERARESVLEKLRRPLPPRSEIADKAVKSKSYAVEL